MHIFVYVCKYAIVIVFVYYSYKTQYYADANEAESWMKEKDPLSCSVDYGRDGTTAKVRYFGHFVSIYCTSVICFVWKICKQCMYVIMYAFLQ